ncbi:hypothetical protein [Bacillus cereus]|uniref:NADH dehydrogenase n=1 Tax=Bacillus cereus TaxID=1396 RepID=A0AAW5L972_BACCE|nr:hypothetical protein [Bacillus cereus]MCQ6288903.1 hypothetical protein [Bacillus cereus]MCQ6318214.1 hypothetical protein [Bacillus cereus]MCQ6329881.1 hypothetical protein [Bacillus cereus]MCQ6385936.1 hypothetical protein [Bacillus cereus]
MIHAIKKIVLTVVLIGMVVGMVILYFYINALQDAVQKVVQDPIYGSVVSQDYAMLSEKDGNYVYTVMTDNEKKSLDQANTENKFKSYPSQTGKIATTQAMTIKKESVLYHLVCKDEDTDKPYLVQYQEENGTLKVTKIDEYQEKISQELGIPTFHFLEAKEMKN